MHAPPFHPMVVHVPMALSLLMPLVTGGLLLAWWRGWVAGRVWLIAVALQATLVFSGTLSLRTGEAEEDRVEQFVAEHVLEEHEESAEIFVATSGGVLALMLLAAALRARVVALPTAAAATLGSILVLGFGYRTGRAGGSLVYQHGAAGAYVRSAALPGGHDGDHRGAPPEHD